MKFEMKKRILALALVGTTAFSVFGAAMSANAATVYWNGTSGSSHQYSGDTYYYQSYTTPAGTIHWDSTEIERHDVEVAKVTYTETNLKATEQKPAHIDRGTPLYVTKDVYDTLQSAVVKNYVTVIEDVKGLYYDDIDDFADKQGYNIYETESDGSITVGKGASALTYYVGEKNGDIRIFLDTKDDSWTVAKANGYTAVADSTFYSKSSIKDGMTLMDGDGILKAYADADRDNFYFLGDATGVTAQTNLYENAAKTVWVPNVDEATLTDVYTDAGYTALDATDVEDLDAIMANPVVPNGVIYLYDYAANLDVSADAFARAWANDTVVSLMKGHGTHVDPEDGFGSNYSIRRDVIDEFEAFLEDIGVRDYYYNYSDDELEAHLTAWAKDTINNYAWQYYNESVVTGIDYNHVTGELTLEFGGYVNLYNFDDLVEDIINVARNTSYTDIQTSELVYLMQQYDKFVGDYVDEKPVETDEWGDLLASLVQAPTEDEFRTSAAYKKYTGRANDLVESYENAATASAVTSAERAMYGFVTNYQSEYRVAEKADTSALSSAIDNTYFNTNWVKVGETYGGVNGDGDGKLGSAFESDSDYSNAWALYPAADYTGTVTGSEPGVTTGVTAVNDSYYWFYNVYTLAYNIYTDAQFTSVTDLAASALNDAVDALTPTYNAYASEILGAEEQNDELTALIEGDYTTSMWANKTKISNYITERVSNDEIGHTGSRNAATIAKETVKLMGYQKNQTVISKGDIASVKTAKSNAEAALEALRADEDNYNAAQANALEKAIEDCDYIIDIYNGDYAKSGDTKQSLNGKYSATTGDKDQILKSDITDATQAVEDAINFSNIIMGWSQDEDGNWMYGTEEGYLNDGWHQVDGGKTWFYFNEDGTAKQSEWWQDGSTWYWFNSNCGAAVGWAKIDGDWYYFKGNNAMKTGWEKVEGSWYYMNSSGKMVTGWCQINGTWYYFSKESNALGQMLANTTTPDGYKVDANGALVE